MSAVADRARPFTVLVEGNIGCGKTTFLQHFSQVREISYSYITVQYSTTVQHRRHCTVQYSTVQYSTGDTVVECYMILLQFSHVEVLKEPVDRWRDVNGHNMLQLMYEDQHR